MERPERLADLLHEVNKGMFGLVKETVNDCGLSPTSMMIMRYLHEQPGHTISELSRLTGIAKSHVSKTVDSLVERGAAEKRPDPTDQRLTRIYATGPSGPHFQEMRRLMGQRLAAVVSALPEEKVDALIDGLQVLKSALEQGVKGPDLP